MAFCINSSQGGWPWEGTAWTRESAPGIWECSGGSIGGRERERQKEHPGSSLFCPENPQGVPPLTFDMAAGLHTSPEGIWDRKINILGHSIWGAELGLVPVGLTPTASYGISPLLTMSTSKSLFNARF